MGVNSKPFLIVLRAVRFYWYVLQREAMWSDFPLKKKSSREVLGRWGIEHKLILWHTHSSITFLEPSSFGCRADPGPCTCSPRDLVLGFLPEPHGEPAEYCSQESDRARCERVCSSWPSRRWEITCCLDWVLLLLLGQGGL